jgi:hypothetical protein
LEKIGEVAFGSWKSYSVPEIVDKPLADALFHSPLFATIEQLLQTLLQGFFVRDQSMHRTNVYLGDVFARPLIGRVKEADRLDTIPHLLDAHRVRIKWGIQVDYKAPHRKITGVLYQR